MAEYAHLFMAPTAEEALVWQARIKEADDRRRKERFDVWMPRWIATVNDAVFKSFKPAPVPAPGKSFAFAFGNSHVAILYSAFHTPDTFSGDDAAGVCAAINAAGTAWNATVHDHMADKKCIVVQYVPLKRK